MDFELTEIQKMIRETVRDFAEREIKPVAQELDEKGEFSVENTKKIGELGLFGMYLPEKYGGQGLDTLSYIIAVEELARVDGSHAATLAAHNSLGIYPLYAYGTEEQKNYYLPRLAEGTDIPCFALTAPTAGSDATSIPDTGIVCKGQWQGKEVTGMRLNFSKRYITLSPIATLVGLAFRLQDPDHLIGDVDDYGITCALLPRETEGLIIGKRHLPVGDAFLNGPLEGENVRGGMNDACQDDVFHAQIRQSV